MMLLDFTGSDKLVMDSSSLDFCMDVVDSGFRSGTGNDELVTVCTFPIFYFMPAISVTSSKKSKGAGKTGFANLRASTTESVRLSTPTA
jgi:hypothetical protein